MKYWVKLDMDNKLKYLEMIQNLIERMANNCFLLKGWSITLITVIFALADQTLKQDYFLFAYIPVIAFWFLDSYYLQLERKYKVLYEIAIKKDINEIDFDLSIDGITYDKLKSKVDSLKEFNPMMGHRGCRLAITYPEIAEMQTRAVIEAAIEVNEEGMHVTPEIMIPLVGDKKELAYVKKIVCETADQIIADKKVDLTYKVGTMIEIPRAALTADEIAEEAEFFSFGTNDLTQMTYGFSRDDASKFLKDYYAKKIFEQDPFATLDQDGVGKLVKMASELGRKTRPDISLGICDVFLTRIIITKDDISRYKDKFCKYNDIRFKEPIIVDIYI